MSRICISGPGLSSFFAFRIGGNIEEESAEEQIRTWKQMSWRKAHHSPAKISS